MAGQYGGTKTQPALMDIRDIRIPVIPREEQMQASEEIDSQLTTIDQQRELRSGQLRLLAERRQALITAAVTGQIDVTTARGVSVP